jgi:hypothetical protein
MGKGSSGDSIVILSKKGPGESPLLPSPISYSKTGVIPNFSTKKVNY